MKRIILFALLILTSNNISLAGNGENKDVKGKESNNSKIISGKVVDVNSKEEIAGAEIIISNQKVYTDLSGNFSVVISTLTTEATVKYISYKDSNIKVDPFSYSSLVIEIIPQQ